MNNLREISPWYLALIAFQVILAFLMATGTHLNAQNPYPPGHRHPARTQDGRCEDGHFHIDCEDGKPQPDLCDNGFKNEHPCQCEVAQDTVCDPEAHAKPGKRCKTYCREKACSCLSMCPS